MRHVENPWLRQQLNAPEASLKGLAYAIGLPPCGSLWITEHVNRLRHMPDVERRLAAYFGLSVPRLRRLLWPPYKPPPRVRARTRASSIPSPHTHHATRNQESK